MSLKGYRILLIGGGGAIGVELTKVLLKQGASLVEARRPYPDSFSSQNIEIVPFMELSANCPKIDLIINAAGYYSVDWSSSSLKKSVDSNIGISLTIAQYILKNRVPVVTLGSYFERAPEILQPWSYYTTTKIAGVSLIEEAADQAGTAHTHLYLYDNYGAEIDRGKFIDRLINAARTGEEIIAGDEKQVQDLTSIRDIAFAIASEASKLVSGENRTSSRSFQIRSFQVLTLLDMSRIFQEVTGVELEIRWNQLEPRRRQVFELWDSAPQIENWNPTIKIENYFLQLKTIF
jgi:nucleoside-diphosphate-sugar epimerase